MKWKLGGKKNQEKIGERDHSRGVKKWGREKVQFDEKCKKVIKLSKVL